MITFSNRETVPVQQWAAAVLEGKNETNQAPPVMTIGQKYVQLNEQTVALVELVRRIHGLHFGAQLAEAPGKPQEDRSLSDILDTFSRRLEEATQYLAHMEKELNG